MPEIERARENLNQSGKPLGGSYRRDSLPMMGGARGYSDFGKPSALFGVENSFLTIPK